jgi:hypothetical protein
MDRERLDLGIDRELRRALTIAPSPDFAARVRSGVAQESPRHTAWLWVAGAVVCAAAAVLAITPRIAERSTTLIPPTASVASDVPLPSVPRQLPVERKSNAVRQAKRSARRDVEVIVPRGQADAIRRFAEDVNALTNNAKPLPVLVELYEGDLPSVPSSDAKWSER